MTTVNVVLTTNAGESKSNGGFASPVAVPKRVNSPGPSQHGEKIINKIKRAQVSLRAAATKC